MNIRIAPLSVLCSLALAAALFGASAYAAQEAAPAAAPAEALAAPAAEAAPAPPAVDPLVARGEYLARAGNCFSCHTREGGEP